MRSRPRCRALAKLRDGRVKASAEVIQKSPVGGLYRVYLQHIVSCDQEIERALSEFQPRVDPVEKPLPPDCKKRNRNAQKQRRKLGHRDAGFDVRTEAYKLFGVDVTQIPGLETSVFPLFSEVGRDLSRWPPADRFVSWLGLCPDNDISGGKILWRALES
jgi:hypothetical protein